MERNSYSALQSNDIKNCGRILFTGGPNLYTLKLVSRLLSFSHSWAFMVFDTLVLMIKSFTWQITLSVILLFRCPNSGKCLSRIFSLCSQFKFETSKSGYQDVWRAWNIRFTSFFETTSNKMKNTYTFPLVCMCDVRMFVWTWTWTKINIWHFHFRLAAVYLILCVYLCLFPNSCVFWLKHSYKINASVFLYWPILNCSLFTLADFIV